MHDAAQAACAKPRVLVGGFATPGLAVSEQRVGVAARCGAARGVGSVATQRKEVRGGPKSKKVNHIYATDYSSLGAQGLRWHQPGNTP